MIVLEVVGRSFKLGGHVVGEEGNACCRAGVDVVKGLPRNPVQNAKRQPRKQFHPERK